MLADKPAQCHALGMTISDSVERLILTKEPLYAKAKEIMEAYGGTLYPSIC